MKDDQTYTVKKFSNSAHVILPKILIGQKVKVIPIDSNDDFGIGERERLTMSLEGYRSDIRFMERHPYFSNRPHLIENKKDKLANIEKRISDI